MSEDSWAALAARAAELLDVPFERVNQPFSPAARQALADLTEAIVAEGVVTRRVAEMAVTRWLIERNSDGSRRSIEECVREEAGEP